MAKIGGSSRGDSPFGGDAGDDKSTNHEPEDQTAEGYAALAQLFADLDDPEFYTLPPGEWEAKNGRDKDGFPLK